MSNDPDVTVFRTARRWQGTSDETDPVTGEKRIVGHPRQAIDLDNVAWLLEVEQ